MLRADDGILLADPAVQAVLGWLTAEKLLDMFGLRLGVLIADQWRAELEEGASAPRPDLRAVA